VCGGGGGSAACSRMCLSGRGEWARLVCCACRAPATDGVSRCALAVCVCVRPHVSAGEQHNGRQRQGAAQQASSGSSSVCPRRRRVKRILHGVENLGGRRAPRPPPACDWGSRGARLRCIAPRCVLRTSCLGRCGAAHACDTSVTKVCSSKHGACEVSRNGRAYRVLVDWRRVRACDAGDAHKHATAVGKGAGACFLTRAQRASCDHRTTLLQKGTGRAAGCQPVP
jgi:hypothetical protein